MQHCSIAALQCSRAMLLCPVLLLCAGTVWKEGVVHPNTMSVTSVATVSGSPVCDGELVASSREERRGVQSRSIVPPFGPYAGTCMFLLLAFGRGGELVEFAHVSPSGSVTRMRQNVTFVANGIVGDALEPLVLSSSGA